MPILKFHGTTDQQVNDYFNHVGELAQILNIDVEHFAFYNVHSTIIGNGYDKDAIFVSVDWIGRPLKQGQIANHIQDFFKSFSKNIYVRFSEVNNFLYLNGEQVI